MMRIKRLNKLLFVVCSVILATFVVFFTVDVKTTNAEAASSYMVTFKVDDGSAEGETVAYSTLQVGDAITEPKLTDNGIKYFNGWLDSKNGSAVSVPTKFSGNKDLVFWASYGYSPVKYTVKFVDEDSNELYKTKYRYGEAFVIPSEVQQFKPDDETYRYTFDGLVFEQGEESQFCREDTTLKLTYKKTYVEYYVGFRDYNGKVLQSYSVHGAYHYGETIVPPQNPTRESDDEYSYTFAGWDTNYTGVCTENAIYFATYTQTPIVKSAFEQNIDTIVNVLGVIAVVLVVAIAIIVVLFFIRKKKKPIAPVPPVEQATEEAKVITNNITNNIYDCSTTTTNNILAITQSAPETLENLIKCGLLMSTNGITKQDVIEHLNQKFGNQVMLKHRDSKEQGIHPIADTHFKKLGLGKSKCFAYVYELENNNILPIVMLSDPKYIDEIGKKYVVKKSNFPKSKTPWYAIIYDNSKMSKEELFNVIDEAYNQLKEDTLEN